MDQEQFHIYTVSGLTREIRDRLETHFSLVWVSGEVSNLRQPLSGHYYFTLKDAGAQLRAVLFKGNHQHMRFKPVEGSQFLCRGRLTVYEPRGEYQLVVDYLEPLGLGALAQAFEALKTRLQAEGLFAPELKKPLPFLPKRIALVTSPTGAAVRDFLRLQKNRHPNLEILIYPVKVQGVEAAGEIARALDDLPAYPGVEVIVMARGGGSIEDLWPFNEELVARAIHRCPIPVVSAVGHEVDFTIADFVADARAATPSAAVELIVPDKNELNRRLDRFGASLNSAFRKRREAARRHLDLMARRLPDLSRRLVDLRLKVDDKGEVLVRRTRRMLSEKGQHLRLAGSRLILLSPRRVLIPWRQRLEQAGQSLGQSFRRGQEDRRRHLEYCRSHLDKLNPLAILSRGYAVATLLPQETVIRDAAQVPVGAEIRVRVARGRLDCEVEKVSSEQ
ncbi:MAG: exodeoxyribonuclease VII large subunit [Deltaproteobacteria bacterium]|nr:exodeoxyribonuclease VII large subunit [Deltaproteobacteria bacterium]